MNEVILVNTNDREIGSMEKLEAHRKGVLHRAFSIFIFNDKNELMLQKRAESKYHSGGLWTNTCCSHPAPGQNTADAAVQRLEEEMGFTAPLEEKFSFIYRTVLGDLIEHELDHVFFGKYNDAPELNPDEASDWKFESLEKIAEDLKLNPEKFTVWFSIIFEKIRLEAEK